MKYRVIKISSYLDGYPECVKDTIEFPNMIKYLEDEYGMFVIDENGDFCDAIDFFNTHDISEFIVNE